MHADMERDNFMTPAEAVEYGIADRIMADRRPGEPKRRVGVS
ncbi:MAG TPA: ATP-dependent Clp protease proteolytic subunit [Solirubrobacteraceae bacterium]|nr:ATP-dependent Clp protease proteolytic subunit [Solirubrobacteraceae bacterium]